MSRLNGGCEAVSREALESLSLTPVQWEYLERVRAGLPLAADLHRSDLLLYLPDGMGHVLVYAHARPHSMASLYKEPQVGCRHPLHRVPLVARVLTSGGMAQDQRSLLDGGAPVVQYARALQQGEGAPLGALMVETNLMEAHRLKLRARAFRRALRWVQDMLVEGRFHNTAHLSPFGEVDGLLLVDGARIIHYISGRGSGIYRRLGFLGDLRGQALRQLGNEDNRLVLQAFTVGAPLEVEVEERGRHLVKSVIPLSTRVPFGERVWLRLWHRWHWPPYGRIWQGALIVVRDVTAARRQAEELRTKDTLLQEVHHRVKNNLQTIASLLHMQARRVGSQEAQQHLLMAASRVRAVAEIHEFLQYENGQAMVSMRDLCQQVARQVTSVVVPPEMEVNVRVEGPNLWLVGHQATAMALVTNELVLNAIQHGIHGRQGEVIMRMMDLGTLGGLQVINPDDQLPSNFDPESKGGLGLRIVSTLVRNELNGTFHLYSDERGVVAEITFQKRAVSSS